MTHSEHEGCSEEEEEEIEGEAEDEREDDEKQTHFLPPFIVPPSCSLFCSSCAWFLKSRSSQESRGPYVG